MIGFFGEGPASSHACSRAGCDEEAEWAIEWRNPKIHTEDRRKIWLACGAHRDYLEGFLAARSFPLRVITVSDLKGEK